MRVYDQVSCPVEVSCFQATAAVQSVARGLQIRIAVPCRTLKEEMKSSDRSEERRPVSCRSLQNLKGGDEVIGQSEERRPVSCMRGSGKERRRSGAERDRLTLPRA